MATVASPIILLPKDRDPLRNFNFRVDFVGYSSTTKKDIAAKFASFGFISVSGIGINTETIPYREGGDNTITRKMPGQSDVGPLQLIRGVYIINNESPMYEWYKSIFSVQWGKGNTAWDDDFRLRVIVRVLKHPVTEWNKNGYGDPNARYSAGMMMIFHNAWPSAIQWNDLNAGDNSVMVETMTLQHEGFEVLYGSAATTNSSGGSSTETSSN
jgi:phage tail-like protein